MIEVMTKEMNETKNFIFNSIEDLIYNENIVLGISSVDIIEKFFQISPPVYQVEDNALIKISVKDLDNSKSIKPGNILINWRKLMHNIPDLAIAFSSAYGPPWVIPFIIMYVLKKIYDDSTIKIEEEHSICLVALWECFYKTKQFTLNQGHTAVDLYMKHNKIGNMSKRDFNTIIDELKKIGCVRISENNVHLEEQISIKYT